VVASTAQGQQTKMKVDVPFDFYAGDRSYPAGEYTLYSMSNNDAIIRIGGNPEAPAAFIPSNTCSITNPSQQTKLVFHRVGPNYFLYQVWVAGNLEGRQFPLSRTETQLAENGQKTDTVILAARLMK
jgi:hypothetical protein